LETAVFFAPLNNPSPEPSELPMPDASVEVDLQPLVARAKAGDDDAFGEVVKAHYPKVYGVIYRMVQNAEDAKELTQIAWVKAWQRLASFEGNSKFSTWMYRLAVNTAMDFLRSRARQKETVYLDEITDSDEANREAFHSSQSAPEDEMHRDEIRVAFHKALEELTPEHRQTLMLREVDGLSYKEIADVMKCRMGTVMSRIFYARKQIQGKLRDLK
jgi:RNA polymerase sigma-70 factor, ECF subfamily